MLGFTFSLTFLMGKGYEHYNSFTESFSLAGIVMLTDGDLSLKLISVKLEECVRPFKAACDEFSQAGEP